MRRDLFYGDAGTGGAPSLSGEKVFTDKATVKRVQEKLHALAAATKNRAFDPYEGKYRDDGVLGSRTKAAVVAFNAAYGWPTDGPNITAGTLTALERPDVKNPSLYAAQQEVAQAETKVATAMTPQAKADAQEELAAAKRTESAVNPSWYAQNVPGINRPLWQVGLGAIGAGVLGYMLLKKSGRPYRRYAR